jgi:hypothetical protein
MAMSQLFSASARRCGSLRSGVGQGQQAAGRCGAQALADLQAGGALVAVDEDKGRVVMARHGCRRGLHKAS